MRFLSSFSPHSVLAHAPYPSQYLRTGAVKAFADGLLGSGTAYFYDPFLNQGNNRGLLSDAMHPISLMLDRYMKADAAGLQICTHAIGDEGISTVLALYAKEKEPMANRTGDSASRVRSTWRPRTSNALRNST